MFFHSLTAQNNYRNAPIIINWPNWQTLNTHAFTHINRNKNSVQTLAKDNKFLNIRKSTSKIVAQKVKIYLNESPRAQTLGQLFEN